MGEDIAKGLQPAGAERTVDWSRCTEVRLSDEETKEGTTAMLLCIFIPCSTSPGRGNSGLVRGDVLGDSMTFANGPVDFFR